MKFIPILIVLFSISNGNSQKFVNLIDHYELTEKDNSYLESLPVVFKFDTLSIENVKRKGVYHVPSAFQDVLKKINIVKLREESIDDYRDDTISCFGYCRIILTEPGVSSYAFLTTTLNSSSAPHSDLFIINIANNYIKSAIQMSFKGTMYGDCFETKSIFTNGRWESISTLYIGCNPQDTMNRKNPIVEEFYFKVDKEGYIDNE